MSYKDLVHSEMKREMQKIRSSSSLPSRSSEQACELYYTIEMKNKHRFRGDHRICMIYLCLYCDYPVGKNDRKQFVKLICATFYLSFQPMYYTSRYFL